MGERWAKEGTDEALPTQDSLLLQEQEENFQRQSLLPGGSAGASVSAWHSTLDAR